MNRDSNLKTGRIGLYAALLALAVLAMFALRQCTFHGPGTNPSQEPDSLALRVAIEYSPLAVEARGDSLAGFGYELISALQADTAFGRVKFIPVASARHALQDLDSGLYDMVVAELPMTLPMKRKYLFSRPIYLDHQVLVQPLDSLGKPVVADQLGLAGKKVAVAKGSPAEARLHSLAREIGDSIIIMPDPIYGPEQLVMLVNAGERPMAVVNAALARKLAPLYTGLDMGLDISMSQFQAWVVSRRPSRRGRNVAASLDSALSRFMATEQYSRLLERYNLSSPK